MRLWESVEGSPFPLGVRWIESERAYNFALYSKHAETVRLLLYTANDVAQPLFTYEFDYRRNKSGPVWHCRLPESDVNNAKYYAYQVDGPPPAGEYGWHNFDPEKILVDPYARAIHFPNEFDRLAACRPGSNAGKAPLGVLTARDPAFDWEDDERPRHDSDLVIYELHLRGFTQHPSSGLPANHLGTFLGVIDKIPYLVDLGITAVELMPVFQFDPQEGNYWGYMPLHFFAPHHEYASDPNACSQRVEFCSMVKALHKAGIEVILDVVYNHTCEGGDRGPNYSYKGIDSSTYYMVTGDADSPYANYSGTGNTLHTANRAVRRCILDSLRFWDSEMHVDGFRFDLASIFTRDSDGSVNLKDPPILGQISADFELGDNRLIAEPWDAGGAFHLGKKFPGQRWMQWNSRYRDTLQRFLRGELGLVSDLMTRIYGSDDLFPDDRNRAYQPALSVNYVSSHDGLTLYDLVAYNAKRNWDNGQENRDGGRDYSQDCGWHGDEGVPDYVIHLRKQLVKNFVCLLMLSNGTPMFRMGDEFMQTQRGNNNPYNQDNDTSWLNWDLLRCHADVFRFFKEIIAFRKMHPSISRSRFWRDDVAWYGAQRRVDLSASSQQLAYCLHGSSQDDDNIYVMINGGGEPIEFEIHENGEWQRIIDTSKDSPDDFVAHGVPLKTASYILKAQAVCVLRNLRTPTKSANSELEPISANCG